jgi:hypothetical protein
VGFTQIFFSGTAPVAEVEGQIAAARTALARGADPARLGQPTMLPASADQVSVALVARDFGDSFAAQLATLPEGVWAGPVASALGAHLVRVAARTPAGLPRLEAVRPQVARGWENEHREGSRTESYRQMRSRYDVVIEPAVPPT